MNCQSAREHIAEALAASREELTGEVTDHVQSCAGCRAFYAQQTELFRAMDSGLSAMANEPVPASLLPRVRARMEGTRTASLWLYRLLPIAAILVIACLIAFPLVRRSVRSGAVQVAVIPKRIENGVEPRPPQVQQPEESAAPSVRQGRSSRHSTQASGAHRPARAPESAVLVDPEESRGLLQLAAAALRSPRWAQAMVHPAAPPASQIAPIEPVEIANLEVNPLSEESQ